MVLSTCDLFALGLAGALGLALFGRSLWRLRMPVLSLRVPALVPALAGALVPVLSLRSSVRVERCRQASLPSSPLRLACR